MFNLTARFEMMTQINIFFTKTGQEDYAPDTCSIGDLHHILCSNSIGLGKITNIRIH